MGRCQVYCKRKIESPDKHHIAVGTLPFSGQSGTNTKTRWIFYVNTKNKPGIKNPREATSSPVSRGWIVSRLLAAALNIGVHELLGILFQNFVDLIEEVIKVLLDFLALLCDFLIGSGCVAVARGLSRLRFLLLLFRHGSTSLVLGVIWTSVLEHRLNGPASQTPLEVGRKRRGFYLKHANSTYFIFAQTNLLLHGASAPACRRQDL